MVETHDESDEYWLRYDVEATFDRYEWLCKVVCRPAQYDEGAVEGVYEDDYSTGGTYLRLRNLALSLT